MNAAAKMLEQNGYYDARLSRLFLAEQSWKFLALVILVVISAFSIIYERTLYRSELSIMQSLQENEHALQVEAKQLLLEQTTWAKHVRVENVARNRLHMSVPEQSRIIVVRK